MEFPQCVFHSLAAVKVFGHRATEEQASITFHTTRSIVPLSSPATGHCGKTRRTGVEVVVEVVVGIVCQISLERMEPSLLPVLRCTVVKALPVQ